MKKEGCTVYFISSVQSIIASPIHYVTSVIDDLIEPGTGFDTHPHENMEIISYVVDGVLAYKDSMAIQRDLTSGLVPYVCAGIVP